MLPHLPLLKPLGVDSYKIEGRMKSLHYVSSTVKVYRETIDTLWEQGEEALQAKLPGWLEEMDKVSHRDYSAGFLFGKPGAASHNLENSNYIREYEFVAFGLTQNEGAQIPTSVNDESGHGYWVEQRYNFKQGEILEVFSPSEEPWTFEVKGIWTEKGEQVEVARHAKQILRLELPRPLSPFAILRRAKKDKK
jgi:putative protease